LGLLLLSAVALLGGCRAYDYKLAAASPESEQAARMQRTRDNLRDDTILAGGVSPGGIPVAAKLADEKPPALDLSKAEEAAPGFLPAPVVPDPAFRLAEAAAPKKGAFGPAKPIAPTTGVDTDKDSVRDASSTPPPTTPAPSTVQVVTGPMLIYDATVTMAVFEAVAAIDATMKLTHDLGGYLVRRDDRTMVLRVPAARYREALEAIGKLGDVLHLEENVQDVTAEFLDLEVRLQNARALRARLEQLLTQAKNVEEALMVQRELGRVTEEIERFEGRLKLLRELVAFSTITVQFAPRATDTLQPAVRLPFPWLDQLGLAQLLSL